MKIKEIKVENYRLLKDFSIDLEDDLSLVIGKNNTGNSTFWLECYAYFYIILITYSNLWPEYSLCNLFIMLYDLSILAM